MDRRGFLSLASATVLGGCTAPLITNKREKPDPLPSTPFKTFPIGDRLNLQRPNQHYPHRVLIWNAAGGERKIYVKITSPEHEEPLVSSAIQFPADSMLEVNFREPGTYSVTIRAQHVLFGKSVSVRPAMFDCNRSAHEVKVDTDGSVSTTVTGVTKRCRQSGS
jgi:hypothetical protein